MAHKPSSEPNKFIRLRKTIAGLHKDISFLHQCLRHGVTPISHKVKVYTNNNLNLRNAEKFAEEKLIRDSIDNLYAKLDSVTLESYRLHSKLANDFPFKFSFFLFRVKKYEQCEAKKKKEDLDNKLEDLLMKKNFDR